MQVGYAAAGCPPWNCQQYTIIEAHSFRFFATRLVLQRLSRLAFLKGNRMHNASHSERCQATCAARPAPVDAISSGMTDPLAQEAHPTEHRAATTNGAISQRVDRQSAVQNGKKGKATITPIPGHFLGDGISVEEATTPIRPEHFMVVNGMRFVLPYHFDFRLHVKKRMVGQSVVDLFASEFPVRPRCAAQLLDISIKRRKEIRL
jgi:hypothetical protein